MPVQSQVLARKYRPQVFADLIGQDALVRTITNAISQNRLAQAYMLTGIRGVGKTTSARIIAKGLNCIGEDGKGGMTPNPCGKCKHCQDIMNDAHIDVIEIDAASNTGVDNVREIIEGAKYNPVSARYKIYIIDEVHMLSKAAFNALLKTLEEPPERVKFIFATTEIRKVPVTILSRCQRFDLKRIDVEKLTDFLTTICSKEKKDFSREALHLIAKAGDGSVRDSLSLLDQAMTQLSNNPGVDEVRQMLGLADKSSLIALYQSILNADMDQSFKLMQQQYESGTNILNLAQDMMDLTYQLTCLKTVPKLAPLLDFNQKEQKTLKEISQKATLYTLTANWQILMKGLQEIRTTSIPLQAMEMLLVQMAYLSDIGTPEQLLSETKKYVPTTTSETKSKPVAQQPISSSASVEEKPLPKTTQVAFKDIQELAEFARKKGERILAFNLETFMRPISFEPGIITCSFAPNTPGNFVANLSKFLRDQTGTEWQIKSEKSGGQPTLKEQKENSKQQLISEVKKDPAVAEIEKLFAGAKIEKIKPLAPTDENEESSSEEDA